MEITLIIIGGLLIVIAIICSGVIGFLRWKKSHEIVLNFKKYMILLNYFMAKAYDMIHKDRILTYSLEAMKIPDREFTEISYEYARLVIKLMGPNIFKDFTFFYGNRDTLMFNLIEYFNVKYEDDEVRHAALDSLSQEQEESPPNG
jgi:hypothetical protein